MTLALLLANAVLAQTQTWNLATNYPTSYVNPNGAWRYGYWDGGLTTFTLYNTFVAVPAGETRNNVICHNGDLDSWGNVGKDISSETFTRTDWPHHMHYIAGKVNVMSATVDTDIRTAAAGFVAPGAGEYTVTVTFKNNSADGDPSRVLVISSLAGVQTVESEATISGFGDAETAPQSYHTYSYTFPLLAGDAIYFANAFCPTAEDARWHQVGVDAVIQASFPAGAFQFTSAAYTQAEGDNGTATATVTVARTGGSSGAVSVDYATSDGSAAAGSDYAAASGTLTWADGDMTNKTFTVAVNGDATLEEDETINLTLSNPTSGALLGTPNTAVLTVANDEIGWSLATDYPRAFANPNGVWRYGYWDGGLTAFTLYNTFDAAPAGETRNNVICHNGDLDSWGNVGKDISSETFTRADWPHDMHYIAGKVNVMSATVDTDIRTAAAGFVAPGAGDYKVTVTFKNNSADGDPSRVLVISSLGGVQTVESEATISGFGDLQTAPQSYHTYSYTFPLLAGDAIYFANAFCPTAVDARWHQVGVDAVIETPFPAGVLQFSSAAYSQAEGDSGAGAATITVTRSSGSTGAVSVDYAASDGSATAGSDYAAASGTLTWADGDMTSKTFTVTLHGDTAGEPNETVNLVLSNPTGEAILGTPGAAVLTILNDDAYGNLATDYPASLLNPHGSWSYGYWDSGLTTFTLYNTFNAVPAGEARNNTICHNGDLDSWGNVGKNISSETFTRPDWPHGMHYIAGKVNLMSATVDSFDRLPSAGWQAPAGGDYRVTVDFRNNITDGDSSRVQVITEIGGVRAIVHTADLSGFDAPSSVNSYSNVFTLGAGDRIYFSTVGHPSSGSPGWHQVGVEATITAASVPYTWTTGAGFSSAANPSGAWRYGYVTRVGGAPNPASFVIYDRFVPASPCPLWCRSSIAGVDPNVTYNSGASSQWCCEGNRIDWDPGEMSIGAGLNGELTVVRWTAPVAGHYDITARFLDNQEGGDSADAYVYLNSTQLFADAPGTVVGTGVTYSATARWLAAGDTLDFILGPGADGSAAGNHSTLDATIKLVTLVTTWAYDPPTHTMTLNLAGVPGLTYRVQSTENFTPPVLWTDIATNTAAADGRFSVTDAAAPAPGRFYRAVHP